MQSVSVWSVILTGGMEGVFRCIGCQCPEFLRFLFQVYRQGLLTSMRSRSKAAMYSGSLDPYGNGTQGAPSVISVVTELGEFLWQDEAWMKERERFASREVPVSIYETDVTEWKTVVNWWSF